MNYDVKNFCRLINRLKNKKFIFKMLMSDLFKRQLANKKVYYGVLIKNIMSSGKEQFDFLSIGDQSYDTLELVKKMFIENSGEFFINSVNFGGTFSVLKNKSKNTPIIIFNPIFDSAKQNNAEFIFQDMHYSFKVIDIETLVETFNLSSITVNHLIWASDLSIINKLVSLSFNGIKIVVAVHDFFYICPSFNLLNYEGRYCNLPSLEVCDNCLNRISRLNEPHELLQYRVTVNLYKSGEQLNINNWRLRFSALFNIATQIILPSQSTRELFLKAYPLYHDKSIVVNHDLKYLTQINSITKHDSKNPMCVAVMGEITYNKGLKILEGLVSKSREDSLNILFLVIGRCNSQIILDSANTIVLNEYVLSDLNLSLAKYNVSLFLFLSIWPETFSFVAHEMMQTKLPILSFNLGAQGEFIGNYSNGVLVNEVSVTSMYDALICKYNEYEQEVLPVDTKSSLTYSSVSVAIATYNGERYIKEQLDSILAQTYQVNEIIVVDDCSSDETWSILVQYAANNSKIKIIRNEANIGGTKSFEKAICACNGDYIALADQDDVWLSEKIATLVEQIGDNWLIHSDAFVVDANLNVLHQSYSSLKPNLGGDFVKHLILNDVTGCTVLFSRDLIEKCFPIPDGYYVHDHYLALMASFFNRITYCDKPLIYYRQHSANQIGSSKLKDYAAWQSRSLDLVNSFNALLSTKIFENNLDVKQALRYYEARLNGHKPSLSVYLWSYKHFGLAKTMEYLAMTLFGSYGAKLIFKLIRS